MAYDERYENVDQEESWVRELLEDVSYNIMRISVEKELLK